MLNRIPGSTFTVSIVTESVKVILMSAMGSNESMTSGTISAILKAVVTLVNASICANAPLISKPIERISGSIVSKISAKRAPVLRPHNLYISYA